MVKMAIYTQKYEQKLLKINNRWGGDKDVPGGKKLKINNQGGRLFGSREYLVLKVSFYIKHLIVTQSYLVS